MTTKGDFDKKYNILDEKTPPQSLMRGRYKQSFAYYTLLERLPVILTNIIDNMTKEKDALAVKYGEKSREENKTVIGLISKLKYELQTDKPLQTLEDNESDSEIWNNFISTLDPENNTFFGTCWLYAECYMYRKVYSFVANTQLMKNFDYFEKQKENALIISVQAMEAVVRYTRKTEKNAATLTKLLKLNLWGNRCDLSISTGKEVKPINDPIELISKYDAKLVVDNTSDIWKCLNAAEKGVPIVIDVICDNAGYETFTDFILAEYIIDKRLASKVRFNVKTIPWFISDLMSTDFYWTLQYLREHESSLLSQFGKKLTNFLEEGKIELAPADHFWTSPYEYYRMREIKPDLYSTLAESYLVIFKGDLNYRKLLGDYTWDFTENFEKCLREFQPTNLCTLRSVKADLICGLRPGLAEELFKENKEWMVTGEYGVIQFAEKTDPPC